LQDGLFSKFQPRPLNRYVLNHFTTFQCPCDVYPIPWSDDDSNCSCYDWVGNSYHFNADGYPGSSVVGADDAGNPYVPDPTAGLAGAKVTHFKNSSETVLFFDAAMAYDVDWHPQGKGNVCYLDSHVSFTSMADAAKQLWK
jgi:prepilin-type processing-associated H-X9-DG protein